MELIVPLKILAGFLLTNGSKEKIFFQEQRIENIAVPAGGINPQIIRKNRTGKNVILLWVIIFQIVYIFNNVKNVGGNGIKNSVNLYNIKHHAQNNPDNINHTDPDRVNGMLRFPA